MACPLSPLLPCPAPHPGTWAPRQTAHMSNFAWPGANYLCHTPLLPVTPPPTVHGLLTRRIVDGVPIHMKRTSLSASCRAPPPLATPISARHLRTLKTASRPARRAKQTSSTVGREGQRAGLAAWCRRGLLSSLVILWASPVVDRGTDYSVLAQGLGKTLYKHQRLMGYKSGSVAIL